MEFDIKISVLTFVFCTVFHQTTSTPFSPTPITYSNFESLKCLERYASISKTCGALVSRDEYGRVDVEIPSAPCCDLLRKVKCMVDKSKADGQCSAELLPHFYYFRSQLSCTEEKCAKEKTCRSRYGDIGSACGATVTRTQQGVDVEVTYPRDRCCEGYRKGECMLTQANADAQCNDHLLPLVNKLLGKFACTRAECDATTKQPDNGHNASLGAPGISLLTTIILGIILGCLPILL